MKIKKYLLFAMAVGMLTACDPIKDEASFDVTTLTADELLAGATFAQYSGVTNEDGTITYTPSETGNYIEFNIPAVSSVDIYYIKKDGSEFSLSTGKSGGMFNYVPSRGSDPTQTLYFRYINQDGDEVVASKQFTLDVAQELSDEMKLLVSVSGTKVWKWNLEAPDGQVWGNAGLSETSDGKDFALKGSGKWWGVTTAADLTGQLNHSDTGVATGEEDDNATMVMTEDGMIYCYDANGNEIRSGKFEIQNYDPTYSRNSLYCGILHTDAGSILFPFEINSADKNGGKGRTPTDFYIAYLSTDRLVLVYPDDGEFGAEATFWQFSCKTDLLGCLTGNDSKTWEWDNDNGQCWGNAGYGSFVYGGSASVSGNTWWGITSDGIAEQVSSYGYGFDDGEGQTMTFTADGLLTKTSGGSGSFSVDATKTTDLGGYNEGTTMGRLTTTGDGILFAQRINAQSSYPNLSSTISEFDIAYISDDHLILITPCNYLSDGHASWEEGTFWRFKAVK